MHNVKTPMMSQSNFVRLRSEADSPPEEQCSFRYCCILGLCCLFNLILLILCICMHYQFIPATQQVWLCQRNTFPCHQSQFHNESCCVQCGSESTCTAPHPATILTTWGNWIFTLTLTQSVINVILLVGHGKHIYREKPWWFLLLVLYFLCSLGAYGWFALETGWMN